MAISVAVMVGESADWIPEIVERCKELSVGTGASNADITPMNNKAARDRAFNIIK